MFDDIMILGLCKKLIDESGGGGSVTPEEIQEAVDKYLEEHPVQPTPIDDTLTLEGYAADAKAVGDALKEAVEGVFEKMKEMGYITEDDLKSISDEDITVLFGI